MLTNPNRTKQLSTVALITCSYTRVKPVVRMCVGFGQTKELSMGSLLLFYFNAIELYEIIEASSMVHI